MDARAWDQVLQESATSYREYPACGGIRAGSLVVLSDEREPIVRCCELRAYLRVVVPENHRRIEAIVQSVRQQRLVTEGPPFLVGFGNAASLALSTASVLGNGLTGVAVVHGELRSASLPSVNLDGLPVLLIYSTQDHEMRVTQTEQTVEELEERGAQVWTHTAEGAEQFRVLSKWLDDRLTARFLDEPQWVVNA